MTRSNATTFAKPSDLEIEMTRVFTAPRELVFRAYTDPALIPQWWGLRDHTTIVDVMDVRPGGAWRYIQRDQKGNEYAFRGEFREIVPPERLISTFEYEGMPGKIAIDTAVFTETDGQTTVTVTSLFPSVEDRDGMLASGMEAGAAETWERLAELLERLQAQEGTG